MRRLLILATLSFAALTLTGLAQPPSDRGKGDSKKSEKGKGKGKGKGADSGQPSRPEDKANFGTGVENPAPATPEGMTHIAGRWYFRSGIYYYRDAAMFHDLFSQTGDSNGDGIPDLKVSHDDKYLILDTQDLPNHPHAPFPNSRNPNTILPQKMRIKLPLVPRPAEKVGRVPMGPIGVAINGVVFFNPFEAGGVNAIDGYHAEWLDSCCGHPQQTGVYHYHKYPSCVKSPFVDDGKQHSPPIGFAADGYPVYGPYESANTEAKDVTGERALDICNGHFDPDRGYHYHVTPGRFPYIIGGYAGVAEGFERRMRGDVVGAIRDNATGTNDNFHAITVTPERLSRGKSYELTIVLEPGKARIPEVVPTRVVVGPYEATGIRRSGNAVTATLNIPADSRAGSVLDVHLEWSTVTSRGGPTVLKKNDAVRMAD
ncbi:MAG: YHYH protein [Gemmataceae bacterium]|nr:YHYH protein [Gemmataceae bacterium]